MVSLFKRSPQCRASPWSQILLERTNGLPSDRTATDGWRRTKREQIMKLETSGPCAGRKHVGAIILRRASLWPLSESRPVFEPLSEEEMGFIQFFK
jgi:hypothetical protein